MGDHKKEKQAVRKSQRRNNDKDPAPPRVQNGDDTRTRTTAVASDVFVDNDGETVHQKLDRITLMLADALRRLDTVEGEIKHTNSRMNSLEDSLQMFHESHEEINEELKGKANKEDVDKLERKIDDLENRSRRNNVVFWGFPESVEEPADCKKLISEFLETQMDLKNIEMDRAHRSPMGKFNPNTGRRGPRPIHVKFLRYSDREEVLRTAPKALKDKRFKGQKIFVSDDVSESVRKDRKKLITLRNKLRNEGKFASLLWAVPACLLTKNADGTFKRILASNLQEVE